MPQNAQDPQLSAKGPFSAYLDASNVPQPTYQSTAGPVSGWGGKTAGIGSIADKFLEGVSRGRAQAYQKSMNEKTQTYSLLSGQIQQLQQSDLPPEIKAQQLAKLNDARGHVFLNALDDGKGGSSKGKKGGGQSSEGDDNHPGPHIMNAVKSIVTGMLGPGKQPGTVDPKELQELMTQTNQLIGQAPQISAQHLTQQVTSVNQALSPLVKANNGQLPTFSKAMSDPGFVSTLAKTIRPDGSYPPPVQSTIDAMQAREKAQTTSDLQTQRDTAAESRLAERDRDTAARLEASKKADQSRQDAKDRDQAQRDVTKNQAEAALKKAETAKNWAEAGVAQQKITDLKADRAAASNILKNGRSLDSNAWDFISTGRIDTKGLGKEAGRDKDYIMDRVDKIQEQLNIGSGDVAAIRAGQKADTQALTKLNTSAQQVAGFEGVLNRNLDTLAKLDKSNPRYNVQLSNRVQQAFKTGKGDPEALNMAAQLHGVSREWAKIMAGNMSAAGVPISEAKEADDILSRYMSSGQIQSLVANVIKPDAANRTSENKSQLDSVRKRLRTFQGYKADTDRGVEAEGGGAPPATPQANTAPPQAAAGNTTPPTAAQQPGPPQADRPSLDDIFKKKK